MCYHSLQCIELHVVQRLVKCRDHVKLIILISHNLPLIYLYYHIKVYSHLQNVDGMTICNIAYSYI